MLASDILILRLKGALTVERLSVNNLGLKAGHLVWIFSIYNIGIGFFIEGFDAISQSISEVALEAPFFAWSHRTANVLIGLSMCFFSFSLIRLHKGWLPFSTVVISLLGLSMISAGIWTLETPLHLLYNLSIFMILVPVFFAVEFKSQFQSETFEKVCLLFSFIHVLVFWSIYANFIPYEYNGLIQRLWAVLTMGWFGLAAKTLTSSLAIEKH